MLKRVAVALATVVTMYGGHQAFAQEHHRDHDGRVEQPYGPRGGPGYRGEPEHRWGRPEWDEHRRGDYERRYQGYPQYRSYGGYYGLAPALQPYSGLSFLSNGVLVGTYVQNGVTVYVYLVNQDGQDVQYTVDQFGDVLSVQPALMP